MKEEEGEEEGEKEKGKKTTIPGFFAGKILRKTDDASGGKREFVMRRDETSIDAARTRLEL